MIKRTFTEIWNEAYNIYADPDTEIGRYARMQDYLNEEIKKGTIGKAEAHVMAMDVMATAEL